MVCNTQVAISPAKVRSQADRFLESVDRAVIQVSFQVRVAHLVPFVRGFGLLFWLVSFRQDYRSDLYQDSVRKRLGLVRRGSDWLIAEERVVAMLGDANPGFAAAPVTGRRNAEKASLGSAPVKADVAAQDEIKLVEDWAQAWAAQDVDRYLDAYAPAFKPTGGQSREAWERLRRDRVTGPEKIQLSISRMRVLQREEDRAAVTFRQDYKSDRYRDSVRKRLELARDGERWLITEERVLQSSFDRGVAA